MNKTKQEAVELLGKAINHIEKYGFDIKNYWESRPNSVGVGCYIGTLRVLGGQTATLQTKPKPAVKTALNVLDHLAEPLIMTEQYKKRADKYRQTAWPEGRTVEAYGFELDNTCVGIVSREEQKEEALRLLHEAKSTLETELHESDVIAPAFPQPVHVEQVFEEEREHDQVLVPA